jgi:hypothetical protein
VTKYEEMCNVAETARKNWNIHRDRCRQYMASLIATTVGVQAQASRARLIQILLKSHKRSPNLFRFTEVGNGVGSRVGIFQSKQRS